MDTRASASQIIQKLAELQTELDAANGHIDYLYEVLQALVQDLSGTGALAGGAPNETLRRFLESSHSQRAEDAAKELATKVPCPSCKSVIPMVPGAVIRCEWCGHQFQT